VFKAIDPKGVIRMKSKPNVLVPVIDSDGLVKSLTTWKKARELVTKERGVIRSLTPLQQEAAQRYLLVEKNEGATNVVLADCAVVNYGIDTARNTITLHTENSNENPIDLYQCYGFNRKHIGSFEQTMPVTSFLITGSTGIGKTQTVAKMVSALIKNNISKKNFSGALVVSTEDLLPSLLLENENFSKNICVINDTKTVYYDPLEKMNQYFKKMGGSKPIVWDGCEIPDSEILITKKMFNPLYDPIYETMPLKQVISVIHSFLHQLKFDGIEEIGKAVEIHINTTQQRYVTFKDVAELLQCNATKGDTTAITAALRLISLCIESMSPAQHENFALGEYIKNGNVVIMLDPSCHHFDRHEDSIGFKKYVTLWSAINMSERDCEKNASLPYLFHDDLYFTNNDILLSKETNKICTRHYIHYVVTELCSDKTQSEFIGNLPSESILFVNANELTIPCGLMQYFAPTTNNTTKIMFKA